MNNYDRISWGYTGLLDSYEVNLFILGISENGWAK